MSDAADASTNKALRRLFLALFLRGRGARGLKKDSAPGTIASKLMLTLGLNLFVGAFMAAPFVYSAVFVLSLYMHAVTFMMLGMFVAGSAGEVLFNKEESEILMHRPVTPQALLRAKILVMLQVALWIAGALNLVAFGVGMFGRYGNPAFIAAHIVSVLMSAVFSISLVVATYQLGLKWVGRERLDNLLTTIQVIVSISFIVGVQVVPRVIERIPAATAINSSTWWLFLVPPAWFAGIDEVLIGNTSTGAMLLAGAGVTVTLGLTYLATVTLAGAFGRGLQKIQDVTSTPIVEEKGNRWLHAFVRRAPMSWVLRDPVARASFLLICAYMLRDREVKLRLYPAMAPVLVFPLIWMFSSRSGGGSDFGLALGGAYLCIVPISAISILEFSQQWQASDVFRIVPLEGPGRLLHGVRAAVMLLLALPMFLGVALIGMAFGNIANWPLLVPGLIALPVFGMIACVVGNPLPLSRPTEEAKSAGRGVTQMLVMFGAIATGFVTLAAWKSHRMTTLILVESAMALAAYIMCRQLVQDARWRPIG